MNADTLFDLVRAGARTIEELRRAVTAPDPRRDSAGVPPLYRGPRCPNCGGDHFPETDR